MTNEAPLPDDVEKSLSNVACGAADYSDCTVLRAHVSSLYETIAALQAEKMQWYHNATNNAAELLAAESELFGANNKITALEAENKRLRSLIERSVNFVSLYAETQKAGKFLEELKSAIAQTDDTCLRTTMSEAEPCKTCNGSRLVGFKDELGHCVKCCQDCNGTGKEKAK